MTTNIIECFEVQLWDGGDRHIHECYVMNESDAKTIAGKHGAVYKKKFIIHESKSDYDNIKNGEIKRQALAKLTDLERSVLGLSSN